MRKVKKSNVDIWLESETNHKRQALENASRYFDKSDSLTVNMLEAIYGQESSFDGRQGKRGASGAVGHFQLKKDTAKEYNLIVSGNNDQRFDVDYASSAAARYLKNLDNMFKKITILSEKLRTISVKNNLERKKFILGAFNGGQKYIALAQYLAERAGDNPQIWDDVREFLMEAGVTKNKAKEICGYVENILVYENEFAEKSAANKNIKNKEGKKEKIRCAEGHWVTIDDRPIFICD